MSNPSLDTLVNVAKRRGLVFQTSEIYGGIAGFYDYGPYGVQLAKNIKDAWWFNFVEKVPNIYGLDSAIIQHPKLWEASGHVAGFNDPMIDCKVCKNRFRADHVADVDSTNLDELNELLKGKKCPSCGNGDSFTPARNFNMMFKTSVGPAEDSESTAYLRPETAGGIFANFELVRETTRAKIPFGIAQVGKAFRNEISPREFLFRVREFEQMELEYFVRPENADAEFANTKQICWDWLIKLGLKEENLQWHQHGDDERAHYAADSWDIQYAYPFGTKELWGIANRTDFDLKAHAEASGRTLDYFDPESNKHFVPYVIEPSIGVSRLFLAVLHSAYDEEEVEGETRVVLRLNPQLAPVQVAILPLSKKAELGDKAKQLYSELNASPYRLEYDETQSIGKRYRRQDEIGTPLCVTVDFESLEDEKVTVRERDSMKQERVPMSELLDYLESRIDG